uniref:Uncharacterized protein n=1 Tax=Pinctada fucata TaxID=50426 RepID=A0A194ANR6_PINFU
MFCYVLFQIPPSVRFQCSPPASFWKYIWAGLNAVNVGLISKYYNILKRIFTLFSFYHTNYRIICYNNCFNMSRYIESLDKI